MSDRYRVTYPCWIGADDGLVSVDLAPAEDGPLPICPLRCDIVVTRRDVGQGCFPSAGELKPMHGFEAVLPEAQGDPRPLDHTTRGGAVTTR